MWLIALRCGCGCGETDKIVVTSHMHVCTNNEHMPNWLHLSVRGCMDVVVDAVVVVSVVVGVGGMVHWMLLLCLL